VRETLSGDAKKRWQGGPFRVIAGLAVAFVLALQAGDTHAQQASGSTVDQALQNLGNVTPDQLRQMFGGGQGSNGSIPFGESQSQTTVLEPTAIPNPYLPQSRLEQIMSQRAGVRLQQFGYEQLGIGRPVTLPQVGGVQDDYILGPGDEIVITLRGQDNSEHRVMVDREGNVVLPRISPVSAAGLRFGEFRTQLIAAVHNAYMATDAYVSIGRIRQISVMVAGEVGSPGVRTLTGLSTPIDAILVSGGVKKTGSLRNVKLIHQGHTIPIDLYGFLTSGASPRQVTLGDGDRLVVPALSKVVAAAGWLRRPGIYEIADGQSAITVRNLSNIAGGLEVRGRYRLAVLHIQSDGQTQLVPVTSESSLVRDGEILMALPGADQVVDRATLSGGTSLSGSYSIKNGERLSNILKAPGALGTSPYTVFGIISRRDPRTLLRTLIAFSPIAALSGDYDPPLISGDIVRVFSMRESRMLSRSLGAFASHKRFEEERRRNPFLMPNGKQQFVPYTGGPQIAGQPGVTYTGPNGQPFIPTGTVTDQASAGALLLAQNQNAPAAQALNGAVPSQFQNLNGLNQQNYAYDPNNPYAQVGEEGVSDRYSQFGGGPQCTQNNPNGPLDPTSQFATNGNLPELPQQFDPSNQQGTTLQTQYLTSGAMANQFNSPFQGYQQQNQSYRQNPAPNFEQQIPSSGVTPLNREVCTVRQLADQLDIDTMVLLNFLADHEVTLDGAVRGPGSYVVGPGINLHDLVMVAGGTVRWADESGVELVSTEVNQAAGRATTVRKNLPLTETTLASYIIKPHDELRFREVFTDAGQGSVTLEGQVRFPGEYRIIRGEHLLDLLKRAGGLTDVAYPYGVIYLRRSVAALEEEQFRRAADQLQNALLAAVGHTAASSRADPGIFTGAQSLVQQLRTQKGLGRISVVADPTILTAKPNENPLLEPGDVVYIPQRPSTVSVLGEVLQPGSFTYKSNLTANDYLSKAGGFSGYADDSLTYIILPDGSAEKLERSWLPLGGQTLPPGSVIVVPHDIAPFSFTDFAINASQIFSQLAVAGASLAVLSTNLK
jgi:protein involved in polysaccharide export with SLBB domain